MTDYTGRLTQLQAAMRERGATLAVFGATDNMRYLTGWAEYGHERLVGLFVPAEGNPAFVVPAMNAMQTRTNPAGVTDIHAWEDHLGWEDEARAVVGAIGKGDKATALIDDELYSGHLLRLQKLFPSFRYESATEVMTRLREVKTEDELAALGRAGTLIDEIYEEALSSLREGMSENDFQDVIYGAFKRNGTRPSFTPLICFGANAAMPHHSSGPATLKRGDVVIIDIGCIVDGYPSDITRTVSFGEPSDPDARRVYEIVNRAHWSARKKAAPGVSGEEVDAAARSVIEEAGYGEYFIHRTGHGLGLSTHEPPDMVRGNTRPIKPGMVFSIEPGIYLPGRFGVRIENIVTATEDGCRSLNADALHELRVVAP